MVVTQVFKLEPTRLSSRETQCIGRETSLFQRRFRINKRIASASLRVLRSLLKLPFLSGKIKSAPYRVIARGSLENTQALFESWEGPELCKFVKSSADTELRRAALETLHERTSPNASITARRLLESEQNLDLRMTALSLLSKDFSCETLDTLLEVGIRDTHWLIRARCAKLLARYQDKRIAKVLSGLALHDQESYVRQEALRALVRNSRKEAEITLLRVLRRDHSADARKCAAALLGEIAGSSLKAKRQSQ